MLTDMTLGQYYPGESVLHHMDPRAKIFCMMIAVITIFSSNSIYSYLFSTLFVILTVAISRVPPVMIWRAVNRCGLSLYLPCLYISLQLRGRI